MDIEWYLDPFGPALHGRVHRGAGAPQPGGDPALPRAHAERRGLAPLAFSRMLGNQDGQVFVLIVLVVAACEVVVGLGLVVAMYRRRLPLDVDEMKELG